MMFKMGDKVTWNKKGLEYVRGVTDMYDRFYVREGAVGEVKDVIGGKLYVEWSFSPGHVIPCNEEYLDRITK